MPASVLREALERVGEAMIDGRPVQVPVDVRRAENWWSDHRQTFGPLPVADSMMVALDAAARRGVDLEAAGIAVRAAL